MKTFAHSSARVFGLALIGFAFSFIPVQAHAATQVAVDQVLPPQGESCPVVGASDVRPYIYEGALHSFDITISDSSFVAVAAQVGDQVVPFNQVTRYVDAQGALHLHVDVATNPLVSDTLVSVTLMSAYSGQSRATCTATVTSVVPAQVAPVAVPPVTLPEGNEGAYIPGAGDAEYPAQTTNESPVAVEPMYPWGHVSYTETTQKPAPKPVTVTPAPVKPIPTLVTATHSLANVCTSGAGPAKVWGLLLVLYAAFVALLASMRKKAGESELDWSIPLTVLSFLGLLFFWYLSAVCRTGAWAPILATIIACAGLIVMTFEEEQDSVLLLEDAKKVK
ncbi:MAG: hypothetical protein RLZZ342_580 [Candidatus Parcubacteria bacterium]|jgi:hypothetical protein